MNLFEVLMNCLYLLGITILIYIIVNLWLDLWMKLRIKSAVSQARNYKVQNIDELRKVFEQVEKEVNEREKRGH